MNNLLNSEFADYFIFGWDHIIDITAYDHILFIMTLCAIFTISDWKKVLVIITAFTIGHSITLVVVAFDLFFLPSHWAEILVPVTILLTAIGNLVYIKNEKILNTYSFSLLKLHYILTLFFGLIHGLAFAGNFQFLQQDNNILKQLLAFNLGIESGQMVIVFVLLTFLWLMTKFLNVKLRDWTLFISGAGSGIATMLIINYINVRP